MEYNILKNNLNDDTKLNLKKIDKNYKDNRDIFLSKKNIKNINVNYVTNFKTKIYELENKLEFYKKYENNLSNDDLCIINNSIEIIDNLIDNLTKNIISKGQVNRNSKLIEFEF